MDSARTRRTPSTITSSIMLLVKTTDPRATAWVHKVAAGNRCRKRFYRSFYKANRFTSSVANAGVEVWLLKEAFSSTIK